jgi:propanol-preferring alcohol dehydrogenase
MSAIQIARELGASHVIAADRDGRKLALAQRLGATPLDTTGLTPSAAADAVRALTNGRGVDVAVELVGHADTVQLALKSVAPLGRAVVVGLNDTAVAVDTYRDLIGREAELIGSNDHLLGELEELTAMAARGALVLDEVVANRVPLDAAVINDILDALDQHRAPVRTVVVP